MNTLNVIDHYDDIAKLLDQKYGAEFSSKNSKVVAQLVQAAALDKIGGSVSALQQVLRSDHPLQQETFAGIIEALYALTEAIVSALSNKNFNTNQPSL